MSKKKATMTLKDFHGGSIPYDLPLPSAPGIMMRPLDRGGYDRHTSWGNPIGRSDHRLRPGSAGTARNFDDKTPFLSHNTHIGRNFDEDERKPLDGASGPRRTVSDESLHALPSHRVEPKMDYSANGSVAARLTSTPGSQYRNSTWSGAHAGRSIEVNNGGVSSQGFGGSSGVGLNFQNAVGPIGHLVSAPHPTAWGLRKEEASVKEPAPTPWSASDAASKLAQASALEKVSSGRWHSRQQISPQTDVEVIRHPEMGNEFHLKDNDVCDKNAYNFQEVVGGMNYLGLTLAKQAEKSLTIDGGICVGDKEMPIYERSRPPIYMEANERNISGSSKGFQQTYHLGNPVGSELQSEVPSELSERPKLKLLPRSKPLENLEPPMDYKLGLQQPSPPVHAENQSALHIANLQKARFLGSQSGNAAVERPKLNLKPRSEPVKQLEGDIEGKRNTLFGGTRPRELVLKERGINNTAVNNDDLVQAPYRNNQDATKTEGVISHTAPLYNDKPEHIPFEHRVGNNPERRDQRLEVERADVQRNWRSENWRNRRESGKHHHLEQRQQQQQQQERPPSPENWRKPVDHSKSAAPGTSGQRYRKAASAIELAQAFSRSISDPAIHDHFSGQRGIPSRGEMPFSRLMGPTPRPQINGY